jgi:hypothetical protein
MENTGPVSRTDRSATQAVRDGAPGITPRYSEPLWRRAFFSAVIPPVTLAATIIIAGCAATSPAASSSAAPSSPALIGSPNGSGSGSPVGFGAGSGSPNGSGSGSAAAPTMTRQTDTVVFKVWGSGYPSIQYGSDSNNNQAGGGYGPLGDGNPLPWSASLTYDPSALYYAVTAQLEGYGDISDSVTEVITTYCSNGNHPTESFSLASGQASGGYAIAQAEYTGGDTGNAQQAESDAGC